MKNLYVIFIASVMLSALFLSCEKSGGPKDPFLDNNGDFTSMVVSDGDVVTTPLYAGKTMKAGEVTVRLNSDGETFDVTYATLPGFCLVETHLSVTNTLDEVPQNSGNPAIGQFLYKEKHTPAVTAFVYEDIPVGKYILAHAVVGSVTGYRNYNMGSVDLALPATVYLTVSYPGNGSYFTTTVTGGGILDGTYQGWCVDAGNFIYPGTKYLAEVYSSYNPSVSSRELVENPGNLDLMNWIVNQGFVGKSCPDDHGIFTFGDVQVALWKLSGGDDYDPSSAGNYSPARVEFILEAASAGGESFVPDCGGVVSILLRPVSVSAPVQITVAQVSFINHHLVCEPVYIKPETAWAMGRDFGGKSWAKYFTYF